MLCRWCTCASRGSRPCAAYAKRSEPRDASCTCDRFRAELALGGLRRPPECGSRSIARPPRALARRPALRSCPVCLLKEFQQADEAAQRTPSSTLGRTRSRSRSSGRLSHWVARLREFDEEYKLIRDDFQHFDEFTDSVPYRAQQLEGAISPTELDISLTEELREVIENEHEQRQDARASHSPPTRVWRTSTTGDMRRRRCASGSDEAGRRPRRDSETSKSGAGHPSEAAHGRRSKVCRHQLGPHDAKNESQERPVAMATRARRSRRRRFSRPRRNQRMAICGPCVASSLSG